MNFERARLDTRKNFFAACVIQSWNALPGAMVGSVTLTEFKNGLDKVDLSEFLQVFGVRD